MAVSLFGSVSGTVLLGLFSEHLRANPTTQVGSGTRNSANCEQSLLRAIRKCEFDRARLGKTKNGNSYPIVCIKPATETDARVIKERVESGQLTEKLASFVGECIVGLEVSGVQEPLGTPHDYCQLSIDTAVAARLRAPTNQGRDRIFLRHCRWEHTLTHGPQSRERPRIAYWMSSAAADWPERAIGSSDIPNSVVKNAFQVKSHVDRRVGWNPDDWGDVDLDNNRLVVNLIYPPNGQVRADVASYLVPAKQYFDFVASPVSDGNKFGCFLDALDRVLDSEQEAPDIVMLFVGGGDATKEIGDKERKRLANQAHKLNAQGTELILGVGHGMRFAPTNATEASVRGRESDARLLKTASQGTWECTTPTEAASFLIAEFVSRSLAANLGKQAADLDRQAEEFFGKLELRQG